jgi:hypothetical protein
MTSQFNPYIIEAPALIPFSGGRTSGYMLRQIINVYGGQLPPDILLGGCMTSDAIAR